MTPNVAESGRTCRACSNVARQLALTVEALRRGRIDIALELLEAAATIVK